MTCTLCHSDATSRVAAPLAREFFHCSVCDLVFLNPAHRLSAADERSRYEEHNNDVTDPRYQDFLRPIAEAVCERVPVGSVGMDFGAGTGPVLAQMLKARGYQVECYDPFFWPDASLLARKYDFICTTEVVEHLAEPGVEFARLAKSLKPGGLLGIMTLLRTPLTDLPNWYYLRDPTHICAYSEKTFGWIAANHGFEPPEFFAPRMILLRGQFMPLTQDGRI